MIATSLGTKSATCKQILELYRLRWQVEIVFKQFKSLFDFDQLPMKTDESSTVWLNGKLLLAAISVILMNEGRFLPDGTDCPIPAQASRWTELRVIRSMVEFATLLSLGFYSLFDRLRNLVQFCAQSKRRRPSALARFTSSSA
jgi:hypothetical protein